MKDKNGDYSIDMIPRGYEVHSVVLNVKYCPVCGKIINKGRNYYVNE